MTLEVRDLLIEAMLREADGIIRRFAFCATTDVADLVFDALETACIEADNTIDPRQVMVQAYPCLALAGGYSR
jgi:hypothetical protein